MGDHVAIITVILSLFLSFTMAENIENNLLLGTKDEGAAHSMPNSHVDCPEGTENIDTFPGYIGPICVPLLFSSVIQSTIKNGSVILIILNLRPIEFI